MRRFTVIATAAMMAIGSTAAGAQVNSRAPQAAASQTPASEGETGGGALRDDWTPLSPRQTCLFALGTKDAGPYRVHDPAYRAPAPASDRSVAALEESIAQYKLQVPGESSGYTRRIDFWASQIGGLAADPTINSRTLGPTLAKLDAVQTPTGKQDRPADIATASIRRMCVDAFMTASFGLGAAAPGATYDQALALWKRDGYPAYFPKDLVNLNYFATREALLKGDAPKAFAYATDPVMSWAVSQSLPYSAKWVASFYSYGIGTPQSLEKALAIFQKSTGLADMADAALIKGELGRKAEGVADLKAVLSKTAPIGVGYSRAAAAYETLSGMKWITAPSVKPPSAFLATVMAIPMAIIQFCIDNPTPCAVLMSSGNSSPSSSSLDNDRFAFKPMTAVELHDAMEDMGNVSAWY